MSATRRDLGEMTGFVCLLLSRPFVSRMSALTSLNYIDKWCGAESASRDGRGHLQTFTLKPRWSTSTA